MKEKSFGETIRNSRLNKNHKGLRALAKEIKLSPAYLSRIETGKEPPPSEEFIERLAKALGEDKYMLLSRAKRVPSEFFETFKRNPRGMASFMRRAREVGLEADNEWKEIENNLLIKKGKG